MTENDQDAGRNEDQEPEETEQEEYGSPYASGVNAVLEAIANSIDTERFAGALGNFIDAHSQKVNLDDGLRRKAMLVNTLFGLAIFIGIGFLGWLKVIPSDGTTSLLGALVGYWYGQRSSTK